MTCQKCLGNRLRKMRPVTLCACGAIITSVSVRCQDCLINRVPTPEEIAAECATIREGWSFKEERRRIVGRKKWRVHTVAAAADVA